MTARLTRRLFLRRMAQWTLAASFAPYGDVSLTLGPFVEGTFPFKPGEWRSLAPTASLERKTRSLAPVSDEAIPTQFFGPGFTQTQLQQAWSNGDLINGFPWGLADVHTMGGIPLQSNVAIDQDGSAVLSIRRPTPLELAAWLEDSEKKSFILEGEKNRLDMRLGVAAFSGRLPTDTKSVEATITLPQRIVERDPQKGMVGIGFALWTLPDMERLAGNLRGMGLSAEEIKEFGQRVSKCELEEDIAEFSLGEPTLELGYPLWVRLLGGLTATFMAGRKTATQKCPRADIMQVFYEPIEASVPFLARDRTITGWVAQNGGPQNQVLGHQPLRVRLEIGKDVYDPTRDSMVVPMSFFLENKFLTPTVTRSFAGFENDPSGKTIPNMSIWRLKTKRGDWVTIPRMFVVNFCSNATRVVTGNTDWIRFSNITITRQTAQ